MTTEAQRLSEYWEGRANELQPWIDEDDYVEFGYRPEGLKREQDSQRKTATELRRLEASNKALVEALQTGLEYAEEKLIEYDQAYNMHPATKAGRGIITSDIATIRAALEQHGGSA